jgi:Uma2 family endonuclease
MSETRLLSRVEVVERMSSSEFFRYAPEDQKAELIDGVMIVHSPPLDVHERLQGFLFALLRMYVEAADLGEVRGSRTPVELAEDQTFEPDILFVAREREEIIQRKGVFGPPDFIVEILSASTASYDRGAKFRIYERAGVRELWLIDPYGPAGTEFYRLEGERFQPVMPDPDGWLRAVAVSDFAIQVEWLWPAGRFIPVMTALGEIASPSDPN